jgi:hypothetical protein
VFQFAPDELIWECSTGITCKCGEVQDRESIKWMFDRGEEVEFDEHVFKTFWNFIVEEASQKKMSHEHDRLTTVGALA